MLESLLIDISILSELLSPSQKILIHSLLSFYTGGTLGYVDNSGFECGPDGVRLFGPSKISSVLVFVYGLELADGWVLWVGISLEGVGSGLVLFV